MGNQIGKQIAKYRKQLGITQERLGEMVGVSGQAVSKWENGGVPDTYLLPDIAKVLGITIDTLFGVEKKSQDFTEKEIQSIIFKYCSSRYKSMNFLSFIFETVWTIHCANFGNEKHFDLDRTIDKILDEHIDSEQVTSQIINDDGTSYLSLVKGFPIFCAVKDSDEISKKIMSEENFGKLFSLFADNDGRKAIIFTQASTDANQYSAKAMAQNMGIDEGKFKEILPLLVKYSLLSEDSVMIDGKSIKVYHKCSNPEIRPILMLAYQFIHARQCYYNFTSNRTKAYF